MEKNFNILLTINNKLMYYICTININQLKIKIMKNQKKSYAIFIIYLVLMTSMLVSSCASRCGQQRRYWNTHRAV